MVVNFGLFPVKCAVMLTKIPRALVPSLAAIVYLFVLGIVHVQHRQQCVQKCADLREDRIGPRGRQYAHSAIQQGLLPRTTECVRFIYTYTY